MHDTVHLQSPDSGTHSHPDLLALLLTLDTLGQSQSPLHIPADGLEAVLELLITVVLLASTGVIAAVMLVATFGHGRDANVKLEKRGFSHLYNSNSNDTAYRRYEICLKKNM